MRSIDPTPFAPFVGSIAVTDIGRPPDLKWLPIVSLRIDPAYQREVLREGARNVGRIAREFRWEKFGVIIVADLGDGLYAIVDGQHRVIAAASRGINEVPCEIIVADANEQAAAFAAINGGVTAISPLAIFAAQVEARDQQAMALKAACDVGGTTVCRYQMPSNKMAHGQTVAIGALWAAYRNHGPELLSLALRCINKASRGTPGLIKSSAITAMCHVLEAEPRWRKPEFRLMSVLDELDLAAEFERAEADSRKHGTNAATAMTMRLFNFLDAELA